jgi:hypothetical protein
VSLEKLQRQLVRDLKKNPAKAGTLALLAVVCIWFWIPLVFKREPAAAAAATVPPATAALAPAAASSSAAPAEAAVAWQELDRQINTDPQMRPANLTKLAQERNPFAMTAVIAEQKRAAQEEQSKHKPDQPEPGPPPESTPDEAGLVLSSTLIGTNKRAALIGGRVYEEGAQVEADDGSKFRLAHIEAQRVLLERNGHAYPLEIKRRTASGRAEIRPLTP